uniref:BPTI/Kunitz inhibitor domain-containing protein n=1 Tax=Glossina austeni TaxID=7395 RepID=A0A1A9V077_GLOAU
MKLLAVLCLSAIAAVSSSGTKTPELCNFQHSANSEDPSFCDGGGQNLWSYVTQANSCVEFYYYGCYGNENRFFSKAQCEQTCKKKPGFSIFSVGLG